MLENASCLHAHTHTETKAHTPSRDREAPHMAFSSQATASCSPAQWALPLIVAARPSLYRSHYSGGGCAAHFFCPYHRQSSSPRPGHMPPPTPKQQTHLRGQSRVGFPPGDLITPRSFTFCSCFFVFSGELCSCAAGVRPAFACMPQFSRV